MCSKVNQLYIYTYPLFKFQYFKETVVFTVVPLEDWRVVRMWNKKNSHSLLLRMQNSIATLVDSLAVSYKTKHILTIRSCNHTPWYLTKGTENLYPQKTCTWMFIVALFIIAKTWKPPRCLSVGEWLKKLW